MSFSLRGRLACFSSDPPLAIAAACAALAALGCSRTELTLGSAGIGAGPSAGLSDASPEGPGTPADAGSDPPGTVASALQIDPAHDGTIDDPLLVGPLTRLWSVTLPELVSYPIIARDIIVVVSSNGGAGSQAQLFAFHGHSGVPAWGPIDLGAGGPLSSAAEFGAATYEAGRLFTSETDGIVRAFDVLTGKALWSTSWPTSNAMHADGSPPTAYGGIVYVEGEGPTSSPSTPFELVAFDESSGAVLWQVPDIEFSGSDPAVTADGVFVSHACQQSSRFDRLAGTPIWSLRWYCSGSGAFTPVVAGGLVYCRDDDNVVTNILDLPYTVEVSNGADAGTFLSGSPPAVHNGHLFVLSRGVVSSVDSLGQKTAWSFGDGSLVTPAIVVSGRVFVGSSDGTLYGLDENTGAKVWSNEVDGGFRALQEGLGNVEPTGLAAAGGLLVAPAGTSLVVYGVSADGGAADGGVGDAG